MKKWLKTVSEKNNQKDDDLKYYHEKYDPKKNKETTPPTSDKIKIPSLWAFEVYPPSYIDNFHHGVEKLGWIKDSATFDDFQSTLDSFRYNSSFGGWINIGRIIDEKDDSIGRLVRKAKLPDSIDCINITIQQFSPSTTILACKFDFKDEEALLVDEALRESYSTYKEKIPNGHAYIDILALRAFPWLTKSLF